jgi:FdrA protein
LFSGGTLAQEAQLLLQHYVPNLYSNVGPDEAYCLPNPMVSQDHTIVDMGEDAFTVGRLHPMIDNDLRIRRLYEEARDPEVAVILLDLVLGYGAHPNPAEELGPAIAHARSEAQEAGRYLGIVVVVVGTDEDPQDLEAQIQEIERAGARVETSITAAVQYIGHLLQSLNPQESARKTRPVDISVLRQPLGAINVGLEQFAESLRTQGAPVIQVDWRPPARGDERLMAILKRMREA